MFKGRLNSVQKNCTIGKWWLPLYCLKDNPDWFLVQINWTRVDIQYALVYKYQPVYNRILVSTFCDILIEDSSSLIMMKDSAVFLKIYIHCQLKEDHHSSSESYSKSWLLDSRFWIGRGCCLKNIKALLSECGKFNFYLRDKVLWCVCVRGKVGTISVRRIKGERY